MSQLDGQTTDLSPAIEERGQAIAQQGPDLKDGMRNLGGSPAARRVVLALLLARHIEGEGADLIKRTINLD